MISQSHCFVKIKIVFLMCGENNRFATKTELAASQIPKLSHSRIYPLPGEADARAARLRKRA